MLAEIRKELKKNADPKKAKDCLWFFKTGKGEYGEGDRFVGIITPILRKLSKKYKDLELKDIQKLLDSPIHEYRSLALMILCLQFDKADEKKQKKIYEFYLSNTRNINNWDLVDISCHKIVGKYLYGKDRSKLYELACSDNLWEKRISIISTAYFISMNDFEDTLRIAEALLHDKHDLIHKAVGWMLREIGKRDQKVEEEFLDRYSKVMPRTMLRYSIEKFSDKKRKHYMKK